MYNAEASNEFIFKHLFNMNKKIISVSAVLFPVFSSFKMLPLAEIYFLPKDQFIGN